MKYTILVRQVQEGSDFFLVSLYTRKVVDGNNSFMMFKDCSLRIIQNCMRQYIANSK